MKRKAIVASLGVLVFAFGFLGKGDQAGAVATSGTLYYTTFAGGPNVNKVPFSYNGSSSFTLGASSNIASTPGADGIIFAPDGDLLVGGQGNAVYKVNPTTGAFTGVNAGGTSAFHIMLDPNKTQAWTSGIPGTPATIPLSPFSNGTAHPLTNAAGAPAYIDTIAWDKSGDAFYTSSGSSGFGTFGKINLTTFIVTPEITGLPAAHGMSFDPFSGNLILYGDDHISQIDPSNPTVLKSDFTNPFGVTFDQGTVDGKGDIFAATNNGFLVFMDYSGSGLVGSGSNFVASPFLASALDDVAPLAGPGTNPKVPEPGTLLLAGSGIAGLAGFRKYIF